MIIIAAVAVSAARHAHSALQNAGLNGPAIDPNGIQPPLLAQIGGLRVKARQKYFQCQVTQTWFSSRDRVAHRSWMRLCRNTLREFHGGIVSIDFQIHCVTGMINVQPNEFDRDVCPIMFSIALRDAGNKNRLTISSKSTFIEEY